MVDSTYVRIPCDISAPLETLVVDLSTVIEGKDAGDLLPKHLEKYIDTQIYKVETTPLKRMAPFNPNMVVKEGADIQSGVYAYTFSSTTGSELHRLEPNVRATCVSMACGLHGQKFTGDVYIARLGYVSDGKGEHKLTNPSFTENEIVFACQSPDLRVDIIKRLNGDSSDIDISLPPWLVEAAKINYEDAAALAVLAKVMKTDKQLDNMKQENSGLSEGSTVGESGYESDTDNKDNGKDDVLTSNARENVEESSAGESGYESDTDNKDNGKGDVLTSNARENVEKRSAGESGYESDNDNNDNGKHDDSTANIKADLKPTFVTKQSLCLHCRRPSDNLCPGCNAAYFCKAPRPCQTVGWSHQAICKTWALYSERRDMLGSFPFEGWHHPLVSRENQISEEPYKKYLMNELGVLKTGEEATWWTTEISGWCGGKSDSAKEIDFIRRLSYEKGFALDSNFAPPERNITSEDLKVAGISREPQCNLLQLNDWGDYYKLRGIPLKSPAALLLTFPLTMHYALLKHGAVPITVAKMLHRQLRIHVIGIEKELNFLDLFKELGFLLPDDLNVELVFVVRQDMLPDSCNEYLENGYRCIRMQLMPNLTIIVQSGTYNETMDPNFDCGTGPPDIIMALNAGLFAYESWRNVIEYLNDNRGIVGVFTDYNEHSGVNCASLGGGQARESLSINPFRQPHAMPVFSMNLPQFSNGFMYVFNGQELDI